MPKNRTITPDRTSRLPPPKNRRMPSMMMFGAGRAAAQPVDAAPRRSGSVWSGARAVETSCEGAICGCGGSGRGSRRGRAERARAPASLAAGGGEGWRRAQAALEAIEVCVERARQART